MSAPGSRDAEPAVARASEPTLLPKLRVHFADFPYLHCTAQPEAFNLGDLMRIAVRSGKRLTSRTRVFMGTRAGTRGERRARHSWPVRARFSARRDSSGFGRLMEKSQPYRVRSEASARSFASPRRGAARPESRLPASSLASGPGIFTRFPFDLSPGLSSAPIALTKRSSPPF